jgi:RNA polymerase sigma factor for flagellar operon FliA
MATSPASALPERGEDRLRLFADEIRQIVAFVSSCKRLTSDEAGDFASFVMLKLIESDYAILRKFEGRSSFRTYVSVVVQRLLIDYRAREWGKWRPSAAATRAGGLAVQLEQLLMRDGHSFSEACEILLARHGADADRASLEKLAGALPLRQRRVFKSDDLLNDRPADTPSPDAAVLGKETHNAAARVSTILKQAMTTLDAQDRLILTMHFVDGRTVANIAAALQLDQKKLYRRMERLLRELRAQLEKHGVDLASAREVLDSEGLAFEWAGISPMGPSMESGGQS